MLYLIYNLSTIIFILKLINSKEFFFYKFVILMLLFLLFQFDSELSLFLFVDTN
jgi:hypothetical protein